MESMKSFSRSLTIVSIIPLTTALLSGCKKEVELTPAPPVRVTVIAVNEERMIDGVLFSGTVESEATTTVSFSVAGRITDMYVNEGQRVSKGQAIARVNSADYENANNIAQAQLAEARDAYERLKKLHDANALPDIKWVEIQNKLKQAENSAEISERALADATLIAPVSGVINRKIADKGQSVIPVEPVVEIVSVDQLTIDIPVTEQQIGSISVGDKASVSFKSLGIDNIEGKVTQKSVVAAPLTRSYTVKIGIPAEGGKILPGMVGEVTFPQLSIGEPSTDIVLPSQAVLLNADNRNFVWVVKNGKAERRFVIADELMRNGVAVKDGLMPGDTVIVEGMGKVGAGTKIETLMK